MSENQAEKIERAIAHARQLTEAGRKAEAVELLKRVCKAAPNNPQAFYALAAAAEGDLRQKALDRAIALDSPLDDLTPLEPNPAPKQPDSAALQTTQRAVDLPGVVVEPMTPAAQLRLGLMIFLRLVFAILTFLLASTAIAQVVRAVMPPGASLVSTFDAVWSSDGTRVAFSGVDNNNRVSMWVVNVDGSHPTNLIPCNCYPNAEPGWSPDGERLVYLSNASGRTGIWAMKIARDNQPIGEPVMLWCCDMSEGLSKLHYPRWSPDGRSIVFGFTGVNNGQTSAAWFGFADLYSIPAPEGMTYDADAVEMTNLTRTQDAMELTADWSPDSKTLAYSVFDDAYAIVATFEVQFLNLETGATRRLSFDEVDSRDPAFSPDGQWIAYASRASGNLDIIVTDLANSQPVNITTASPADDVQADWSPDGSRLLYATYVGDNLNLMLVNRDGSNPVNLTKLMQAAPPGSTANIILWTGGTLIAGLLTIFPNILIPRRLARKKPKT